MWPMNTMALSSVNRPGDLEQLVKQVRAQLKKIAITDKSRVDEMFLRYDRDRTGYIGVENMRDLCRRLQLPVDDDLIMAVSRENGEIHIELSPTCYIYGATSFDLSTMLYCVAW